MVHTLLPYGAGKHMGGKLAEVITTTVKDIFDNDKQGECSVEIVRMIASLVKKKGSNVNGKLTLHRYFVQWCESQEPQRKTQSWKGKFLEETFTSVWERIKGSFTTLSRLLWRLACT